MRGIDDREFEVPIYSPVCTYRRHWWVGRGRRCEAFPVAIPMPVWLGKYDHRSAYPCDNGIRFEPRVEGPRG